MDNDGKEELESPASSSDVEHSTPENVTEDGKMTGEKRVSEMVSKARFNELNEAKKKLEAELAEAKRTPKQASQVSSDVEARLAAVEFMARHKEFDSRHFSAADAIAKGKGITLEEAIKDELFVPYKEKLDSEAAVQKATPSEGRSPKVAPPKPISEMTREEHEAYFRKVLGK